MLAATNVPAQTLAEYEHTRWGPKDGIGGPVFWARQSPAGLLLLKTPTGHQVFDGVGFHTFEHGKAPPFADAARALGWSTPTGAIYYVDPDRRLMRRWQGRTEEVHDKDNVLRWTGLRFTFDADGIGWSAIYNKMYRLDGLEVAAVDASWGLPDARMRDLVIDPHGTLWIGADTSQGPPSADTDGTLLYLPRGARRFERFATPVACLPAAVAPDGSLVCASSWGLAVVTVVDGRPVSRRLVAPKSAASFVAFDHRGGLWVARTGGLAHLSDWRALLRPDADAALDADTMGVKEGLSSDGIWYIEEDPAGAVWLATGDGLDRFRVTPFTPVRLPRRGFAAAIAPDAEGGLWAGNYDRALMHVTSSGIEDVPEITQITAIRIDTRGTTWVSGQSNLWRKDPGGRFVRVGLPPGFTEFRQIAQDDTGAVWFETAAGQFARFRDGGWTTPDEGITPPRNTFYVMFSDEQHRLWFYGSPRPYVLERGVLRQMPPSVLTDIKGGSVGHARGMHVWLGGQYGIGAFVGDTFYPVKLASGVARSITGIIETPEGDLWFNGLAKAYHLTPAQVDAVFRGETVTPEMFDFHDGLTSASNPSEALPTLAQDTSGRLWITTPRGLFRIDPRAVRPPTALPPETLLQPVTVDGQAFPVVDVVTLPPNPGFTEFSYTAGALGVADRIHFRYRLDDIDKDWRDAGTRRTADYTQLPPGRHRFEVMASNEQGVWASTPTTLDVEVQAAWYQTSWFRAGVGLVCGGLVWLAIVLRVRALASRERVRIGAIAAERARIARDLHDTLLQGMQGLILGVQSLATAPSTSADARVAIEGQLDHAEGLLKEARDRVRNLRSADEGADQVPSLRDQFELAASELQGELSVKVIEEGAPRTLRPFARDCIYLVGREALLNAAMHGKGTEIELRLHFAPRRLVLRVHDNGVGIDPAVLAMGARPGHYGLVGMRERAAQLAAELSVARGARGGTDVVLEVPASHAYEHAEAPSRWSMLSRLTERRERHVGRPPGDLPVADDH